MTPILSFSMSLMIYIATPLHILLVFIAIWYAKKDLSVHVVDGLGDAHINARHVFIYAAITPITSVILVFIFGPSLPQEMAFSAQDFIAFSLLGVTSIIGLIAAILYNRPTNKRSARQRSFV